MTDVTLFVGLDVHKKTIAVALVDGTAGADVRFYGTIANTPDSLRTLVQATVEERARAPRLL
jgi:transposase